MLVSVVITTYNQERYIARALDSVLAQKRDFDLEIVIGDDCSTDSTGTICLDYQSRHPDVVRYTRNVRNLGLLNNYYDCMLRTRGKYIADIGGDDFWTDDTKLMRQVAVMEADPGIVLSHTGWEYFDEVTGLRSPSDPAGVNAPWHRPVADGSKLLLPILRQGNPIIIHSCTMMLRRDAMIEVYNANTDLFRNTSYTCEDLQLTALLCPLGRMAYIDAPTMCYSVSKPSITSGTAARLLRFHLGVFRLTVDLLTRLHVDPQDLSGTLSDKYNYIVALAFQARDRAAMREIRELGRGLPIRRSAGARVRQLLFS